MSSGWTYVKPLIEPRLYRRFHAMTVDSDSKVYIFGGETKVKNSNTGAHNAPPVKRMLDDLICYDKATNEWKILHNGGGGRSCPSRRKGCTLTAFSDCSLFLFGGAGPGTTNNDLWEFNLQSNVWIDRTHDIACQLVKAQRISDIGIDLNDDNWTPELSCKVGQTLAEDYPQLYPAPRAYHSAVEHNGRLVIYGGHGVRDQSSALWVYEISRREWRRIPLAGISKTVYSDEGTVHPGIRFGVTSCVYGDGFYTFGGQQNSKLVGISLWRLDLSSFQWQKVVTTGTPPMPHTYAASALFGNRWIIHGGSSAEDVYAETHELNLDSFHWYSCPSMNTMVTLEGHTGAFLKSGFGMLTLTLFGGATKGPQIPESPVLELSLTSADSSVLRRMENLKLEDFVIRPAGAAQLLWDISRAKSELSNQLEKLAQEQSQGREFSETCLREALAQCRDLTAKHSDLSEEMEKVLADKKIMEEKYSQLLRERFQYESIMNEYKERRGLLEQRVEELARSERTLLNKHTDVSEKYGAFLNLMPAVAKALKYAQVVTQPSVIAEELGVNERHDKLAEVQRLSISALKLIKDALSNHNLPIDIPEPVLEVDTGQDSSSTINNRLVSNLKSRESQPTSIPTTIPPHEEELSETTESSVKPKTKGIIAPEAPPSVRETGAIILSSSKLRHDGNSSSLSMPPERKKKQTKHGRITGQPNNDGDNAATGMQSVHRKGLSHPKKSTATTLAVSIDKAMPKAEVSNLRSSPIKKNNAPRGFPGLDRVAGDNSVLPSNTPPHSVEETVGSKIGQPRSALQGGGVLSSPPHPPSGYVNQQQVFSCVNNNNKLRNNRSVENSSQAVVYSPRNEDNKGMYVTAAPNMGITRGISSYSSADVDCGGFGRLDIMNNNGGQKLSSNRRQNNLIDAAAGSRGTPRSSNSTGGSVSLSSMGINCATQCGPGILKLFPSSNSVQGSKDSKNNSRLPMAAPIIDLSVTMGIAAGENSPLRLVS